MKIICIGRNYIDHAKELNNPVPKSPLIFMKPPSALLRNDNPFYYPDFSNNIHYEVELVVKICKNGKRIQKEFADTYYKEVGLGIDFTARDIQAECKKKGHPWEKAKGFDHSAVIGKFMPIEKYDLANTAFSLKKNGAVVQQGNTADMIFNVNTLLVEVSKFFKLQLGDLIYTGTPAGVGPVSIGDTLEGFLESERIFACDIL